MNKMFLSNSNYNMVLVLICLFGLICKSQQLKCEMKNNRTKIYTFSIYNFQNSKKKFFTACSILKS